MSALQIKKGSTKHSAYNLRPTFSDVEEAHTLAVLVDNEAGVLARVIAATISTASLWRRWTTPGTCPASPSSRAARRR